jgi:hypothetical protein
VKSRTKNAPYFIGMHTTAGPSGQGSVGGNWDILFDGKRVPTPEGETIVWSAEYINHVRLPCVCRASLC